MHPFNNRTSKRHGHRVCLDNKSSFGYRGMTVTSLHKDFAQLPRLPHAFYPMQTVSYIKVHNGLVKFILFEGSNAVVLR